MADEEQPDGGKMWYHPVNGSYIICKTANEVPEGFVERFTDCSDPVADQFSGPPLCTNFTVSDAPKEVAPKAKAAPKKVVPKKAAPKKAAPKALKSPTLKKLKMTRAVAEKILKEEDIKFDAKASDGAIAAMVSELLENDKD